MSANMTSCRAIQPDLVAAATGDASPIAVTRVQQHVEQMAAQADGHNPIGSARSGANLNRNDMPHRAGWFTGDFRVFVINAEAAACEGIQSDDGVDAYP